MHILEKYKNIEENFNFYPRKYANLKLLFVKQIVGIFDLKLKDIFDSG
jgi:hypothetical protein